MSTIRYYREIYPTTNDIVMTIVKEIDNYGCTVSLPEYNKVAYVTFAELIKKRTRKKKLVKLNQNIPMLVAFVDINKDHINVSKKRLQKEDADKYVENYKYLQSINKIGLNLYNLYSAYQKIYNSPILTEENIMEHSIWNLFDKYDTYDPKIRYHDILSDFNLLFTSNIYPTDFKEKAIHNFESRLMHRNLISESEIVLVITDIKGVYALRDTLNYENKEIGYTVTILPISPSYKIMIEGPKYDQVEIIMEKIIKHIEDKSKEYDMKYSIKSKNKIVRNNIQDLKCLTKYAVDNLTL